MYMFNGYYSSLIVLIPAMIYTMIVQARINNAFSTYIKIENSKGISGAEAARCMLDANGLQHVQINILIKLPLLQYVLHATKLDMQCSIQSDMPLSR